MYQVKWTGLQSHTSYYMIGSSVRLEMENIDKKT